MVCRPRLLALMLGNRLLRGRSVVNQIGAPDGSALCRPLRCAYLPLQQLFAVLSCGTLTAKSVCPSMDI